MFFLIFFFFHQPIRCQEKSLFFFFRAVALAKMIAALGTRVARITVATKQCKEKSNLFLMSLCLYRYVPFILLSCFQRLRDLTVMLRRLCRPSLITRKVFLQSYSIKSCLVSPFSYLIVRPFHAKAHFQGIARRVLEGTRLLTPSESSAPSSSPTEVLRDDKCIA